MWPPLLQTQPPSESILWDLTIYVLNFNSLPTLHAFGSRGYSEWLSQLWFLELNIRHNLNTLETHTSISLFWCRLNVPVMFLLTLFSRATAQLRNPSHQISVLVALVGLTMCVGDRSCAWRSVPTGSWGPTRLSVWRAVGRPRWDGRRWPRRPRPSCPTWPCPTVVCPTPPCGAGVPLTWSVVTWRSRTARPRVWWWTRGTCTPPTTPTTSRGTTHPGHPDCCSSPTSSTVTTATYRARPCSQWTLHDTASRRLPPHRTSSRPWQSGRCATLWWRTGTANPAPPPPLRPPVECDVSAGPSFLRPVGGSGPPWHCPPPPLPTLKPLKQWLDGSCYHSSPPMDGPVLPWKDCVAQAPRRPSPVTRVSNKLVLYRRYAHDDIISAPLVRAAGTRTSEWRPYWGSGQNTGAPWWILWWLMVCQRTSLQTT